MVIELCGVLYKVVLGLDSSGDKVALMPWVNHYFKYFAHIFHCYKNIFFADETYCVLCTLCAVGNSYGCRVSNSNGKGSTVHIFNLSHEEAYDCPKSCNSSI